MAHKAKRNGLSHNIENVADGIQVYIVDFKGQQPPRELTSGKQGAIHSPVFNTQGTKVAWLELDKDGYESDRYIYAFLTHDSHCSSHSGQK